MQWLIDIIKEWIVAEGYALQSWVQAQGYALQSWVQAQGYLTTGYVDRGDPAVDDFTKATLIRDDAWHELDLSTIVPANAKAIALTLYFKSNLVAQTAQFRRHGNVNSRVAGAIKTQVSNVPRFGDFTVAVDSNRKIDYYFAEGGFQTILLTIKGWWY